VQGEANRGLDTARAQTDDTTARLQRARCQAITDFYREAVKDVKDRRDVGWTWDNANNGGHGCHNGGARNGHDPETEFQTHHPDTGLAYDYYDEETELLNVWRVKLNASTRNINILIYCHTICLNINIFVHNKSVVVVGHPT
jgi:hypothetical protein